MSTLSMYHLCINGIIDINDTSSGSQMIMLGKHAENFLSSKFKYHHDGLKDYNIGGIIKSFKKSTNISIKTKNTQTAKQVH
ncbi:hypothetical protein RO3G_06236 [Rhizopus delemar RA 99-880]|uniref:Uncharacterized protein n=1 Tax=Rhizopus delemar (strain RA 99-880 / ATCC MYA-4621 / FGSC 9543 / NRRL 43880) TaxID=246409 RepID=I1BZA1_RHIO9|nr:hypothetical protein RO3G_06236 [Rhizopus delemar RA 99-880]|eukprot:EIE81531.1 hypothetical protein RO3G_06236 [Rhizopus delemar RA 99-880]